MSILEVKNLSHGFGDRAIFENVSFRLLKGEHIGLVGDEPGLCGRALALPGDGGHHGGAGDGAGAVADGYRVDAEQ